MVVEFVKIQPLVAFLKVATFLVIWSHWKSNSYEMSSSEFNGKVIRKIADKSKVKQAGEWTVRPFINGSVKN